MAHKTGVEADIFRPSRKQSLYHGPYIMIYNGNLDRGRTLREASVWYNYGGLPGLLPTPSAPSLALEKAPFPLGCNQVQGLVVWRVEASVPPGSNLPTKCSYLGRLPQNSPGPQLSENYYCHFQRPRGLQ